MKTYLKIFTIIFSCLAGMTGMRAETYTVKVGQFEKLKVNGNINVIYKNLPDSVGLARYLAPPNSEELFSFVAKTDGSLKVEPSDEKWGSDDLPVICLYSDFLSVVESYSDLKVDLQSLTPCSAFTVKLIGNGTIIADDVKATTVSASITTGNGSIYISGSCINASYKMVGAGLISADRLRAENVKCRILGTGSIGCWPIDNLNITGIGSTKIYYKGKPNIKKTGGGKLFELPEEINEDVYSRLGTPVKSLEPVEEEPLEKDSHSYPGSYQDEEDDDYETVVTADD